MIEIFEDEIILPVKKSFDFKGPHVKNLLDRDFFNMKQVHIKGEMLGYSKTTNLLFKLYVYEHDGKREMELVAWKNKEGKFIPKKKCNKDIIEWCKRSGIKC